LKSLQRTIEEPIERSGVGVNLGREVTVRLQPAPVNTGVVFVRTDLPGAPSVRADPSHVVSTPRRTVVRQGDAEVQMTEHVLAAANGLEIDNLTVEVTGPELPVGDGSARFFAEMLQEAGAVEQDQPRRRLTPREPVTVADEISSITATPAPEGLSLSYTLDYSSRSLPMQQFEVTITPASFVIELAPARSFVFQSEAGALLVKGFGRGASLENTLVARDDGSLVYGELRFPNEFARHKALDLLGDLSLLGSGLVARVVAVKSGHAQNLRLVERLRSSLVEIPSED
jgi:UDP-3-O-acyl N-acetylglucosamine deacetylase